MMNEELAVRIQAGEREYIPILWEQVYKLVYRIISRLLERNPSTKQAMHEAGQTVEDLRQEGFFAVLDTVEAYSDDAGFAFNSYLKYHIMTRLFGAVGLRTSAGRNDPLSRGDRLERQIGQEDGEISLGDILPSEEARVAMEAAEERIFRDELRGEMERCLGKMEPLLGQVICAFYYEGKTLARIGEEVGLSPARIYQLKEKALRQLRRDHRLRGRVETTIFRSYHWGGLQTFKETGYSSTERAAERLILGNR